MNNFFEIIVKRKILILLILAFTIFLFCFITPLFGASSAEILKFNKQELSEEIMYTELDILTAEIEELKKIKEREEILLKDLKKQFSIRIEDAANIVASSEIEAKGIGINSISPKEHYRNNNYYYVYPYMIDFFGSYNALLDFISNLEEDAAGGISFLKIEKNEKDGVLNGLLKWEIYSLLEYENIQTKTENLLYGKDDLFEVPEQYNVFLRKDIKKEINVSDNNFANIKADEIYSFPEKSIIIFNENN